MIVVTGASGQLGGMVLDSLLERVDGAQVGLSVRDPAAAARFEGRVGRVVAAGYEDPDAMRRAFDGAERLLLISANVPGPGAAAALHRAAIDAARDAGAGRILYTSHQAASPDSHFGPMPGHAETQDALAASGVPFTALRNGFYAGFLPVLLGGARDGELALPADGPVSWTSHPDLAEAAAILLAGEREIDGVTPPLTAGEALDLRAVASRAGLRHRVVDDETWVRGAVSRGMPEPRARFTLGLFAAARAGEFDVVDPTLTDLLGRPPRTVEDVLR